MDKRRPRVVPRGERGTPTLEVPYALLAMRGVDPLMWRPFEVDATLTKRRGGVVTIDLRLSTEENVAC